jgi:hypothetical protein
MSLVNILAHLLAFDSILLVREREACTFKASDESGFGECLSVFVMQRCVEGGVDSSMYHEGDITETNGLASGYSGTGEETYSAGRSNQKKARTMSWMVCCWR